MGKGASRQPTPPVMAWTRAWRCVWEEGERRATRSLAGARGSWAVAGLGGCGLPEQGPPRPQASLPPPSLTKCGRWGPAGDPGRGVTSWWPCSCGRHTPTLLGQLSPGFPSETRLVRGPHMCKSSKDSAAQGAEAGQPAGRGRHGRLLQADRGVVAGQAWGLRSPLHSPVPLAVSLSSALRSVPPPVHPSIHPSHNYPLSTPGVSGIVNGSGGYVSRTEGPSAALSSPAAPGEPRPCPQHHAPRLSAVPCHLSGGHAGGCACLGCVPDPSRLSALAEDAPPCSFPPSRPPPTPAPLHPRDRRVSSSSQAGRKEAS